jgi:threonine dehydrogenase-like Zn-dependent dehydrogenase
MTLGLVTEPGRGGTTRVAEVVDERSEGTVVLRPLEIGVCGTDREISEGHFGVSAEDGSLVLGHELLGVVEQDGRGFSRGDLVTATVRRSCGRCAACAAGSPDSCLTGEYSERGITRLHGFARELVAEDPDELIPIPASLGRSGVLAEPASVCARAIRHARAIGGRQAWELRRALVIGAGAVGMLATYLLRLDGVEVWTAALEPEGGSRAQLAEAAGARYVSTPVTPLGAVREEVGGFDLVIEAAGSADVMAEALGLLGRNGVACILGIDPRERAVGIEGRLLALDMVIQNRVLFGSVNAQRQDWEAAVAGLDAARARWPGALAEFVGLRVPLDRFQEAFDHRGSKATLVLADD